jgi:hypothetical protein
MLLVLELDVAVLYQTSVLGLALLGATRPDEARAGS